MTINLAIDPMSINGHLPMAKSIEVGLIIAIGSESLPAPNRQFSLVALIIQPTICQSKSIADLPV